MTRVYSLIDVNRIARSRGMTVKNSHRVEGDGVQAPGFYTLCHNPAATHRYVVHFFNAQDGGFHGGSYWTTEDEALVAFDKRVARA